MLTARAHEVLRESDVMRALHRFIASTYPKVRIHREPQRPYAADGPDSPTLKLLRPDLVLEAGAGAGSHWVPLEVVREFHPSVVGQAVQYAEAWGSKVAIVAVLQRHGIADDQTTLTVGDVKVIIAPLSFELEQSSLRRALDVALGEVGPA